jgi:hypothetical protein
MKRLILSLGILISALAPKVASAQSSPCLNDVTAPDTNWTAGNIGRTSANPLIIKLNPAGYAAIVADSGNGQAGVNLAKVYVPSQFTPSGVSAYTILSAQDDCADTYTGLLASRWPKVTISKGAFTCADASATSLNAMAVSYNVFDAANNVRTGTIWVKVIETINPVLSVKPATLTLSAGGSATLTVADVLVSATDNCGTPNVTLSKTAFGCGDIGLNNVTVTATDASGNTATQTAVVTVVDATAPALVVKNATVNLSAGGTVTLLESDVVTSATDVCDNTVTVSFTPTSFTCANLGNNTVTITATDDSGNNTVQTVTVTVKDVLAPTLTVTDYTLDLDASGSATLVNSNVVVTSSDNCGTPTVTLSKSSFTCSDLGANNVTVTSTDGSGNITTQTAVVTVKDVTNPAVVGKNATIILNASGAATLTNADVVLSSSDNCGTPTVTLSKTSFDCTNLGTNTVTLTATDGSLNSATTTVTVTVVDDLKPSLVVVAGPKTFNVGIGGTVTLVNSDLVTSSSDNCGAPTVTLSDYSFDCSDINLLGHDVTVTAVDASGNTETKTVTVLIRDVTNPVLNVQSYTLNLGSNGTATLTNADVVTSATDNCGTPTVTLSKSAFDCSNLGANSVTVTATDASGNTTTQTATVTVKDVTAPILTKLTYERDLLNGFALLSVQDVLNEIAFDACGVDYTTSALSREYFDCEDVGSSTITASIRDFSGNFAFVNFTVIIHDKVAPIANAKASHTIYLDANGNASVTAADVDNGSSDDCDNFTLSLSQTSFDCDDLGSNTVTFTISDEEVNSSTASVNIIVSDTIRPDWNFTTGTPAACDPSEVPLNGVCVTEVEDYVGIGEVQVMDLNGNIPLLSLAASSIWDATGYPGCTPSQTLASLTDSDPLTGAGTDYDLGAYIVLDLGGLYDVTTVKLMPITACTWDEDDFDGDQVFASADNSDWFHVGTLSGSLNGSFTTLNETLTFPVRYIKVMAALVTAPQGGIVNIEPDVKLYLDQNGSATLDVSAIYSPYVSENCDFVVTSNKTTFTCVDAAASPVTITLTATDDAGNTRNTTVDITVLDTLSPTIVVKNPYNLYLDANGDADLNFSDIDNGTEDNCTPLASLNVVLSKTAFDCGLVPPVAPGGIPNLVYVTVTDEYNNDRTVPITVNVFDTISPSVTVASYTLNLGALGTATLTEADVVTAKSDNCTSPTITLSKTAFNCNDKGANNVVVTATDEAGNTTYKTVVVTVEDNLDPTLTSKDVTVYLDATGSASITNADVLLTSADNCGTPTVTLSKSTFSCSDLGANTVTLTATDGSGNTATTTATVTVSDTTRPALSLFTAPKIFSLGANGTVTITNADLVSSATDNCGVPTVVLSKYVFDCDDINPSGELVTVTATDGSSNANVKTFLVKIVDDAAPDFNTPFVPADVTVYAVQYDCFGLVNVDSDPLPTAFDNCDINVDIERHWAGKIASGIIPMPVGLHTLWAVATDDYGNTDSTAYAYVEVIDTTLPDATFWNNVTVVLGANGTANITPATIIDASYDNCGIANVNIVPSIVDCDDLGGGLVTAPGPGIGYVTLTVTLVDFNGNARTYNPIVAVEDQSAPTFVPLAGAATVSLSAAGTATVVWSDLVANVADNCSVETVTLSQSSFNCTDLGINNIVITATDPSGNVATHTVVLNVVDDIAPSFATKNITISLNASGNATIVPTDLMNGNATDNCGSSFTYSLTKSFFDCSNVGANVVGISVIDLNGNTTTKNATVTVVDDIDPTFTLANALVTVSLDANGVATLGTSEVVGIASDNCSIQSIVLSQSSFDCTDLGNGSVLVTVTDVNGNVTSATQNIVVVDLVAPVVTVKSSATVKQLNAAGAAVISQSDILTSVADNCTATPSVVWSPTSVSCAQVGPVTVSITVTDASGNVTTTTKVIQVVDELAPSLVTKAFTAVLNANGNVTIVETNVVNSKSDNCGVPVVSLSKSVFDCTNKGANNVLVTATDVNGNATTQTAVVTVVDQTAPEMTLASALTVYLNGSGTATISVPDVVTSAEDNCDVPTVTLSKYTYTCADMPSTSITVTAVDAAGNSTVETFTVNVVDALAPVITTKSTTTTIALDANGSAPVVFADVLTSVIDNCTASPTITWFPTTVTCAQVGPVTVSITTTDASGNVSVASKVIQVVDNTNPTLVTKAYTAVLNANGNATVVESNVVQSKSDNCGVPAVLMSKTEFDCTNKGANNVTVTATDANGNVTIQTAVVTVVDQTAPFFTTAPSLTVFLDANGVATVSVPDVVTSSGDNCDVPTVTLSKYTFTCTDMPSTSITITAVDASGNTTTGTYTVSVLDQLAPAITPKATPTTIALDATGNAPVTLADVMGVAVDNCTASPVVTWFPTTVSCAQVGSVTVYITATDASGNFSNSTKVIQVVDNINPTLVTKAYTAVLNANGNATIVESNVVQSKSDNCGVPAVLMSKTEFDCTNKGANNVTVTATDANGNVTTQTAVVTVVDQTAPFFTTAPSLTLLLNANGVATVSVPDVVTSSGDNCDVVVTLSKYTFTCSDMPSTSITVTAVDGSGNTTTGSFTVNVLDQLAPAITPKATPTTIALNAAGTAAVTLADVMGVAVDNCTANPVVTWFPTTVTCAQVGSVTVTITATDASGNFSNATKVIQVVDNISPTLVTKAYTAVLNANGNATIVEANVVQSKSDNCGVPAVLMSKTVFDCTNKGANNVTVTATDANGNVTTQTAVVTVVDQTAPFFTTAPSLTLLLNASGTATVSVPDVVTSSGDNCDVPTVTLSKYTFTCADMPSTSITITAVDASGNTTTGTYTVNVLDQLAPVITPKSTPTTIALDATGNAPVTLADVMGAAVDNCTASPVVTWFPTSVSCAQVGPVTVTITAVDASGNVSNATKVIQIIDNIAPTVVLKGTSLVTYTLPLNASGNATLTVSNVVNTATDNCGTPVVSLSKTAFDCSNLGDNVVVVTAVDQFGNVRTINAIVKVVDQIAPSIVTPSTQVVLNLSAGGTATLPLSQVMLSTSDNCGTPTVTWSPSTFNCSNLGNNTVTITSSDASGNVTTATVVVLVQDVTAPAITTVSGAVTKFLGTNGTVAITQADVVTAVTDACTSAVTVTWTPTSVSCANVGNVAVVVTAIDASGNVSTAVKTILVRDQLAPVISAPASITLVLNAAGTVALPAGVASATDNCAVNGIQYSKTLFDCANLGANTVTITATDVNGNVATSTMTVNVVDNSAPSLTLVASPLTVALNAAGSASVNAAQLVANANDNCAIATYTVTPNTFNCSSLGGNTVTVTATDASGNATSQTVTVNVVDVTGPSIVVNPAAVTVTLNANGVGSITNAQVVSSVSDNCTTAPSVVITPNVFTCADLGQQMVTIFATDAAGNISTTTKLITVVDASAPVIVSAPQNVTLPGCNGNFTYAYQVTDNCGYTATLVSGLASGTQFPVGTTTVTWSFADASGNTTTHSFNVTVLPLGTYTLPAVNEYCAGHGHFDLTGGQTGLVFYGSSVYNSGTTFYTEVPGTYTLNFVFTDANGCTQNGTFNLIVRPRPAKPSIVQVAATVLESTVSGATYQWYRNEQPIVGAKSKQYVFTAGGKYEVVVFNAYGCGTMSEGFVINANGLSVEEIITSVRLFPNPTSSSVTLETSFEAAEDLQVTLVDMVGSVVYRGTLNKGSNQHVLDMSGLAAGTYNVILTNANGASSNVQRVVKID